MENLYNQEIIIMKLLISLILSLLILGCCLCNTFAQTYIPTQFEKDVISEVNICRTNPKLYSSYIKNYITKKIIYQDYVGNDVVHVLDTMQSLSPLSYDEAIYVSLHDKSVMTHDDLFVRINSSSITKAGENIGFWLSQTGRVKSAREVVIELLLDYKYKDYKHRKNILCSDYYKIAVKKYDNGIFIQNFTD